MWKKNKIGLSGINEISLETYCAKIKAAKFTSLEILFLITFKRNMHITHTILMSIFKVN